MNLERFLKVMARECIRRVFHGELQPERIVGKNILKGCELVCTKCHHYSSGCDVIEGPAEPHTNLGLSHSDRARPQVT